MNSTEILQQDKYMIWIFGVNLNKLFSNLFCIYLFCICLFLYLDRHFYSFNVRMSICYYRMTLGYHS